MACYTSRMGAGKGKTARAKTVAGPKLGSSPSPTTHQVAPAVLFQDLLKGFEKNWESVNKRTVGLLTFLCSEDCPGHLQKAALAKGKYILNNEKSWAARKLSPKKEARFADSCNFFGILAFADHYALLMSSPQVSPSDAAEIQNLAQEAIKGLTTAGLLVDVEPPLVVATHGAHKPLMLKHASELNQTARTMLGSSRVSSIGTYASLANVAFISDEVLLGPFKLGERPDPQSARKVVTHEVLHANEVTLSRVNDVKLNEKNFPTLSRAHTMFLREGIVDWLANQYMTGDPRLDLAPGGRYAENIEFVDAQIIPHLQEGLTQDGLDEVAVSIAALLRRDRPQQTFLGKAVEAIPSLLGALEAYDTDRKSTRLNSS